MNAFQIELTEQCNFDCNFCYLEKSKNPKLNKNFSEKLATFGSANGISKVEITGGEPTMHPQFIEIYKIFREKGYIVSIYSNGSNLSSKTIKVFKNYMPNLLEITLYGMTERTYTRVVKREGMFRRVKKNIQTLLEMDANLFLKYNLTKDTYHEALDFKKFVERIKVQYGFNAQIIPKLNGSLEPTKRRLDAIEIKKLEKLLDIPFSQKLEKPSKCDAGDTFYITSQGSVRGCPVLTRGEKQIDWENPAKTFQSIRSFFDEFHRSQNDNYCTAWIDLEGKNRVESFVRSI